MSTFEQVVSNLKFYRTAAMVMRPWVEGRGRMQAPGMD